MIENEIINVSNQKRFGFVGFGSIDRNHKNISRDGHPTPLHISDNVKDKLNSKRNVVWIFYVFSFFLCARLASDEQHIGGCMKTPD